MILLADADQFYVAVARLVDPEGAGKAEVLVVGGSPSGRGVVTSASYEARKFGIHSAMPAARALRLCPHATFAPVPWDACVEKSRHIRRILADYTPAVETASSDEFYLDMTGTERLYHNEPLARTAHRMRESILAETQLSVSIGGGTSKLVAKVASNVAKPGGVHVVPPGEEAAFMSRLALADIPMVGPKAQERLLRYNLRTVAEAVAMGREQLVQWLGEREGNWLWARCHGLDESRVVSGADARSISRDETFARDMDADDDIAGELLALVDRATSDLREDGLLARTVTVKLRDNDFTTRQAGRTLDLPVSSERAVYRVARELLGRLRRDRPMPARLVGVALSGLVRADVPLQLSLLDAPGQVAETERDRAVAKAVDTVRARLGHAALARGRKPSPRRRTNDNR